MLIDLVDVTARGVGLPDLDHRVANGTAVLVDHAAGDDDPLAERLAVAPPVAGEVSIERPDAFVSKHRAGRFGEAMGERNQRLRRRAQHRRCIRRKSSGGCALQSRRETGALIMVFPSWS